MRLLRSIAWLLLAAVALGGAGGMHPRLLEARRAAELNQGDPLENAPPLVAFTTVALGGFRGLVVDILWMRASELQDKGKYFELVQLADWITKLQPRFASIWAYHGWNLAYNVSVMLSDPADRWRWVRHGLMLMRDEGMVYNPGSALLHRELAWMFQHKLGMDSDQAHIYYKREWAAEMTALFGGPRPDLEALAAAPADAETLLRDPAVAHLAAALRAAGLDPLSARVLDPGGVPAALQARVSDSAEGTALRAFVRARRMREVYKLNPARMLEIERHLGAQLEWRLPTPHAVYWATLGLDFARTRFDEISLRRQVFQSLSDCFLRGRLAVDSGGGLFVMSPDLALLPAVRASYAEALKQHPDDPTVRQAHRNFLVDAVMISATYNRMQQSRELYAELNRLYPSGAPASVEAYIAATWSTHIGDLDPGQALAAVEAALYQAVFWKLLGDDEASAGHEQIARFCWDAYMDGRKDPELRARTGLPPIETIRDRAAERAKSDLAAAREAKK
ncbi:MAG: hypothetical protein BWK77_03325 [Verrucomicrobia bacterium A1]|nr:MAG: hypothetical protein BWK77_03325 [Verrucomicrobia bacterium A1]